MFALVDCNSFYASCEQVFRPDLLGRPVVVLSNNDGCIVARSAEAKAMGIDMADPWHEVEPRLPKGAVTVFSSNYTLYGDLSRRVMDTLAGFAHEIECYSIDEAFLHFLPGPNWEELAQRIKQTVRKNIGLPVSVGFAPTKVLAKLANKLAKKDPTRAGVCCLPSESAELDAILARMSPDDVWGIGSRLTERLSKVGVKTALDLKNLDDEIARRVLTVTGLRIVRELQGMSCLAVEEMIPAKKAICCAKSFGHPQETLEEMREPLMSYVSRVAEKLRNQAGVCGFMQVFIETNPFAVNDRQYFNSSGRELATPTNYTPDLCSVAGELLERIYRPGFRYKKVGVLVTNIGPEMEVQSAFDTPPPAEIERRRKLMAAMDVANRSFGRNAVRIASTAGRQPIWWMRQQRKSPRYTTNWHELPVVAA